MSRVRRAGWTFVSSLGGTLSGVAVALIATPLLLRHLGDERVGAYRAASEWIAYIALLDFGIAGSLQVAFARAIATGDRAGVAGSVRAGVRAGLILGALGLILGLGLVAAAPHLLRDASAEVTAELRIGLLFALLGMVWAALLAFRPLAEAGQRGHIVQIALALQAWVTAGLMIGSAVAGGGLAGQFLAVAAGGGVSALILARDGLRRYPEILGRAPTIVLPVVFSGSMFAFNLLGRIGLHSDAIIVGATLGPSVVVAFAVTQRLLLLADAQVMALGAASWAGLAELDHSGRSELFNRRLIQLTRATGVFAFALIVPMAAAGRAFVSLWVGESRYGGDPLVAATAAYVWVHALAALWGWPLITTGRVRIVLPIYLVGIPLNVAISVGGALHWGVAGPALGSALSIALVWIPWLPLLLRREFGTPLRPLALAVLGPAALGVPCAAAFFAAARAYPVEALDAPEPVRWLALGGGMATVTIAYSALAWALILPREDRAEIRARVFGR